MFPSNLGKIQSVSVVKKANTIILSFLCLDHLNAREIIFQSTFFLWTLCGHIGGRRSTVFKCVQHVCATCCKCLRNCLMMVSYQQVYQQARVIEPNNMSICSKKILNNEINISFPKRYHKKYNLVLSKSALDMMHLRFKSKPSHTRHIPILSVVPLVVQVDKS